ncbi:MAG: 3-hydroxyacyl-[acyl-carrier-protein] dehydratase FabZ [Acidiferrobacteraceae bacterium]|nr:3-hydroxyacyl-[acyl-carrier-protein] dehydratase FabZ [Acidiferrobacteraceae bacterium]
MSAIDITDIRRILPHRYPFLMIDRVIDVVKGKSLTAIKNVSINEPFFDGHFPHHPIFPGVLMLECIAQASAILASLMLDAEADGDNVYLFAGVDNARFKKPVEPGDQLIISVMFEKHVRKVWRCTGTITVEGQLACSANVLFTHRVLE